jgi:hypothetical protein
MRGVTTTPGEPDGEGAAVLALCAAWGDALGRRIRPDDDPLALGASSLAFLDVVLRVARRFDARLSARDLFDAATVREQARLLASGR